MTEVSPERIKLESGITRLGLDVPANVIDSLVTYMELLKEWSATYNLIAPQRAGLFIGTTCS